MIPPRRWLEHPEELDATAERVLSAARDARPPETLKNEVWGVLATKLAGPNGSNGDPSAPAGSEGLLASGPAGVNGASALSLLKVLAIGALAGTIVMGGVAAVSESVETPGSTLPPAPRKSPARSGNALEQKASGPSVVGAPARPARPARPATPMPATPAPPSAVRARSFDDAPRSSVAAPLAASSAAFPEPSSGVPAESTSSALAAAALAREESQLVASAREALRGGKVAMALSKLEEAAHRFPNGTLNQERETLVIEALVRAGQRERAERRARNFLQIYPGSPHAARVRAIVARE